jgi:single stranded DNA-binding protein
MKSSNKVQLIGWLAKEPRIIKLKNGSLFARLRLGTDIFIPQKDGAPKKCTTWHTVKVWRQKQIEYLKGYWTTGSHILVDGRIEYHEYEDSKGRRCYDAEIVANYLVDLDR